MKRPLFALGLVVASCFGVDEEDAHLKFVARGLKEGDQTALVPLKDLHSERAAKLVLDFVASDRIGGGIKARLAEVVAAWPDSAPGRATFLDWLAKHPYPSDDELLFYADIHLRETRSFMWTQIESAKDPAKLRHPQRIAMAVKGLGYFEDNPEPVVRHVGSLLNENFPHVIRSCAADALGGMKHLAAVEALIPQLQDHAIGPQIARSLYRLTGQHFDQDPGAQWTAWLAANREKMAFKMHTAVDFDNFLKMQALVNPVDDAAMDMSTFYGIDVRGKGLLFILDVSGSMNFDERINKLRGQMSNILVVLDSRPDKVRFGIAVFGENVTSCFPRGIMPNDEANRKKAQRFVDGLQADGGTPMVEVLEYAAKKILPDANVDTIYFLSDGQPSDGTPEMVLDSTRKIFDRHRVRFNTISIGEEAPTVFGEESLLQQMATLTGGVFTQPK